MAVDLSRLEESPHLIDLLIQMEDVLDALDTYVFANWMDGEIVSGPSVRRYWLGLTLKYTHRPDERGALRLLKHGLQVKMVRAKEGEHTTAASPSDEEVTTPIWLVTIQIPRRLISDMNAGQIDFYDDEGEIDAEDVEDAHDAGMNDETGYVDVDDETSGDADSPDQGGMQPTGDEGSPEGANATQ